MTESSTDKDIARYTLRDKATAIHKDIISGLFHGDSFVVLFDDPFGHRSFRPESSPLSSLRIIDWIEFSKQKTILGKIKILINTPTKFWQQARKHCLEKQSSSILKDNIDYINSSNNQLIENLSIRDYSSDNLIKIVQNMSCLFKSKWLTLDQGDLIHDLIVEAIRNNDGFDSFDRLRLLLRSMKDEEDIDRLLDAIHRHAEMSQESVDVIKSLPMEVQNILIMTFLGESFVQMAKDYLCLIPNFHEFCHFFGIDDIPRLIEGFSEIDYWIVYDRNQFPKFCHPDIRWHVETFVHEENVRERIEVMILDSQFINCFINMNGSIARWQSMYFLCHFSKFLCSKSCDIINKHWLTIPSTEFDYKQTLWAISDNWQEIQDSPFESFAVSALKRIQHEHYEGRRDFIWEIVNNWEFMPEDIRMLVIDLNSEKKSSKQSSNGEIRETIKFQKNDHHFISFLASIMSRYSAIEKYYESHRDSKSTEFCLEFVNEAISMLEKDVLDFKFLSHGDDRVFNNIKKYNGLDVLKKIKMESIKSGGLKESDQTTKNIDRIIDLAESTVKKDNNQKTKSNKIAG